MAARLGYYIREMTKTKYKTKFLRSVRGCIRQNVLNNTDIRAELNNVITK
jgi:arginyl-tRNA--protein-N-Asp/Glu arginylyltransferase